MLSMFLLLLSWWSVVAMDRNGEVGRSLPSALLISRHDYNHNNNTFNNNYYYYHCNTNTYNNYHYNYYNFCYYRHRSVWRRSYFHHAGAGRGHAYAAVDGGRWNRQCHRYGHDRDYERCADNHFVQCAEQRDRGQPGTCSHRPRLRHTPPPPPPTPPPPPHHHHRPPPPPPPRPPSPPSQPPSPSPYSFIPPPAHPPPPPPPRRRHSTPPPVTPASHPTPLRSRGTLATAPPPPPVLTRSTRTSTTTYMLCR